MRQVSEGTYGAEIPASATAGGSVAYYIEAQDKEGTPVASRGSVETPLVITLAGSGRPVAVKIRATDESDEEEEEEGAATKWFFAALVGTGAGWATGNGDTNADVRITPAGFAMAQMFQFAPEVGYWLRPDLMMSVQGRFQYISGTTDLYHPMGSMKIFHTANYAAAVFAKGTMRFGTGKFHPFASFAVGGGQIRHVVTLKQINNCGSTMRETCVDTIAAGPIMLGPGGGFSYDFTDHLALVLQANTQLAFPNFTFNVDGNLGLAVMF
jgi:hypothetical protein